MDSLLASFPEIEQAVSDIEKKVNVKISKKPAPVPVSVEWKCIDPSDVWPLLGSVSDDRITYLSDNLKFRQARSVHVTMSYADCCRLTLKFGKVPPKQRFRALEYLDIDSTSVIKKAKSGSLVLGSDQQVPWKLDNIRLALRTLQELLLDVPDDLSRSIESVHFEAPYARLRSIDISVNSPELSQQTDIVWLVVPPRQLKADEAVALVSLLHNTTGITIIPLLGLPWNVLHDEGEDYSDPLLIKRHLEAIDIGFKETYDGELFPALPLYRNAFIADRTERGNYEPKCMDFIWQATHALGYRKFSERIEIVRRYDDVVEAMMKSPQSILELLQFRSHLRLLKTIKPPAAVVPDKHDFMNLQKEGMQEYSEQAKNLGKRTVDKWEPAAVFPRIESVSKSLTDFCSQAQNAECFENEKGEFIRIADEITEMEFSVLIAGRFKSGKTTFINTLLGEDVLNTDITPGAAIPWRIHRTRSKPYAEIHYRDRAQFPLIQVGSDSHGQTGESSDREYKDETHGAFYLRVDEIDAVDSWLKDGLIDRNSSGLVCFSGDTEERILFSSTEAKKILKGLGREVSAYKMNSTGKTEDLLSTGQEFLDTLGLNAVRLNADIVFSNPELVETEIFDEENITGKLRMFMNKHETPRVAFRIGYSDLYLSFADTSVLANCMIVDTPGSGSVKSYHDEIIHETARKADCYVVLCEIDRTKSSSGFDNIAEISHMAREYGRPLIVIAAKADKINADEIDEYIREWESVLAEKNVGINREDILPIAAYQSRYEHTASLPTGHTHESIESLQGNFQSVMKKIREHIELSKGMTQIIKFGERIDNLIMNAGKRLADKENNLRRRIEEFKKSSVTPEKIDQTEKAEIFWSNFVIMSLQKIAIQPPDDSVKALCNKTTNNFIKYLHSIPSNEGSFENCKKEQWPKAAKKCMKNINKILENTVQKWEDTINNELKNLDEFRIENFPDEPELKQNITLEFEELSVLQISLAVPITKKPGILKSLLSFAKEEKEWKEQTINRFKARVESAVDVYKTEIIFWLKNITVNIDKLMDDYKVESKRNAESATQRIEEYKSILKTGNKPERQKKINMLSLEKRDLSKLLKCFKKYKNDWEKEKSALIIKDIST